MERPQPLACSLVTSEGRPSTGALCTGQKEPALQPGPSAVLAIQAADCILGEDCLRAIASHPLSWAGSSSCTVPLPMG